MVYSLNRLIIYNKISLLKYQLIIATSQEINQYMMHYLKSIQMDNFLFIIHISKKIIQFQEEVLSLLIFFKFMHMYLTVPLLKIMH